MQKIINTIRKEIKTRNVVMNLIGSAVLAFGMYNVHSLSCITEGGVLGMSLLLKQWLHITPAVTNFLLTALCYIIGFRTFGAPFLVYSFVSTAGFSVFYAVFEMLGPVYPAIAEMPLAASLIGAIFVGVGAGLSVRYGGASSGDDALAMSLSKKFGFRISSVYLASDLTVLLLSLSYIPLREIAYSLLTVVLSGQIIDIIVHAKRA